ncbi:MAG: hypothetical protein KGL46_14205 [Hyphomicrobiales bacterium]|nr:hypothetical protein [Hyphomicrobiales bacterium]
MAGAGSGGTKAAIRAVAAEIGGDDACAAASAAGEQIALPIADDPTGRAMSAAIANRRAGRPMGATDKRTASMREWLLRRGVIPQDELLKWVQHGPEALAAMLGCTKLEAYREWRATMEALGRYVMAPLAPVDGEGKAMPNIAVFVGGQTGIRDAAGVEHAPWEYLDLQTVENQQLSAASGDESQNDESQKDEKD